MSLLLFILFSLGCCFFITLILGLLKAARRADEAEERILGLISPDVTEDKVIARPGKASLPISISKASVAK